MGGLITSLLVKLEPQRIPILICGPTGRIFITLLSEDFKARCIIALAIRKAEGKKRKGRSEGGREREREREKRMEGGKERGEEGRNGNVKLIVQNFCPDSRKQIQAVHYLV